MIITSIAISCVLQVNDSTSTTLLERTGWAAQRHTQLNERVKQQGGSADVVFVGDSITQGWEGAGAQVWEEQIAPLHAINLGISGDRTEHVLWRFDNGNLEGLSPQVAVVMIGTNNFGQANSDSEDEVLDGIVAVVDVLQARLPCTHVLLLDIFPRGETFNNRRGSILQVNQALQGLYEHDERVTFLEIGHRFVEDDGSIDPKIMPDYLHLSEEGYRRWANSIMPAINAIQHGGSGMPKKQLQQKPNQKPDLSRGGPWDFDVLVYQVDVRGQSSQLGTFERAGSTRLPFGSAATMARVGQSLLRWYSTDLIRKRGIPLTPPLLYWRMDVCGCISRTWSVLASLRKQRPVFLPQFPTTASIL